MSTALAATPIKYYFSHNQAQSNYSLPFCIIKYTSRFYFFEYARKPLSLGLGTCYETYTRYSIVKASRKESPYGVLGVSPSATLDDIKRAYRRLALKYHPDVNKEADAQGKFMRIKHAYNTLLNSKTKWRYDTGRQTSDYSYSAAGSNQNRTSEDGDFYGFGAFLREVQITVGDFIRDLQEEFQNFEASAESQGRPKSLWEELAEIGEEFVEFLEKELNLVDAEVEEEEKKGASETREKAKASSIEDNIDEIEAALAQLKKELGL